MADINATANIIRFNDGGVIKIGTKFLLNIQDGSLQFTPGLWEPLPIMDRDAHVDVPRRGAERSTELSVDVKFTSAATATELYAYLVQSGTGGKIFNFPVEIGYKTNKDSTGGEKLVFAKCYLKTSPQIQSGTDWDILKLQLTDHEAKPTASTVADWAAYLAT